MPDRSGLGLIDDLATGTASSVEISTSAYVHSRSKVAPTVATAAGITRLDAQRKRESVGLVLAQLIEAAVSGRRGDLSLSSIDACSTTVGDTIL